MNSDGDSLEPAPAPSDVIKLVVRHPVPSLNRLFSMTPWDRHREKKATQAAFMFALSAFGNNSLTLTTFVRNSSLTVSAMLDSYETTEHKT